MQYYKEYVTYMYLYKQGPLLYNGETMTLGHTMHSNL